MHLDAPTYLIPTHDLLFYTVGLLATLKHSVYNTSVLIHNQSKQINLLLLSLLTPSHPHQISKLNSGKA